MASFAEQLLERARAGNADVAERLLQRYEDPRDVLCAIAAADVGTLAQLYQCTPLEAGVEKRLAATAVLPYLASKQPVAIDVSRTTVVTLTINTGDAYGADDEALIATVIDEAMLIEARSDVAS